MYIDADIDHAKLTPGLTTFRLLPDDDVLGLRSISFRVVLSEGENWALRVMNWGINGVPTKLGDIDTVPLRRAPRGGCTGTRGALRVLWRQGEMLGG